MQDALNCKALASHLYDNAMQDALNCKALASHLYIYIYIYMYIYIFLFYNSVGIYFICIVNGHKFVLILKKINTTLDLILLRRQKL